MKGTAFDGPIEHLDFKVDDVDYSVNVTFLLSSYMCIFGQGCPGHFGKDSKHTRPDIGCCSIGFHTRSREDLAHVELMIDELTDEDWDRECRHHVERDGTWKIVRKNKRHELTTVRVGGKLRGYSCSCSKTFKADEKDEADEHVEDTDELEVKSRVWQGACVFSNRTGGSAGKTGCAFHHLAMRTGRSHVETKPEVCWMAPLDIGMNDEGVMFVEPWDADRWGGENEDETHDSWMTWWCIDTPDAYRNKEPVYTSMEDELRKGLGDKAYEVMAGYLDQMRTRAVFEMPGAIRNDGRPMLPLLIGDRTPKGE